MGRGRAKAKQTKVARDLKYRPVNMDVASLERELGIKGSSSSRYEDDDDPYADLAAVYNDDYDADGDDGEPRRVG